MTLQTFNFEGTDGAAMSGLTNVAKVATGTLAFSAADAVIGGTGLRASATAGNVLAARCTINSGKVQAVDVFLRTPTTPSTGQYQLASVRHASGTIVIVEYNALNGISIFEAAGSTRNNMSGVTLANGTMFRIQLLISIGVATNDSSFTAKVFSSASNWTTQVGSTLTRSGINLGTVAAVAVDVGALTTATPGLVVGFDYLRVDDGKTTDFTGPPTATAPTAAAGASDLYPEVGTPVNLVSTGSTAGSGTLTYLWTCTAYPGPTAPGITNATSATATFTPTVGSRYTFKLRVTQTGGLFDEATATVYPHAVSNGDVKVYQVIDSGGWTNEGTGAATLLDAINDPSTANWAQSPPSPTSANKLILQMDPYGTGTAAGLPSSLWADSALDLVTEMYLEDGTTLLQSGTFDLTSVVSEYRVDLDTGDLAIASVGAGRRALIVKIWAQ